MHKKKFFTIIFIIFCFVGILTTTCLLVSWKNDVSTNLQVKKKLEKYLKVDEKEDIGIDFDELKKINPDTVGYIKVPNTKVDYVVVKGKDNDYYLKHDFNKKSNSLGWIFMNYKNKNDGSDKNLVIFGHNTSDGSMFGSLASLLKEEIINNKDDLVIDFYTDKDHKKYQIFSIYTIKPETYYINTEFRNDEFERFKEKVKERSKYKIDVDITNRNIITLSTCQNYGVKRLVIHAVEIL